MPIQVPIDTHGGRKVAENKKLGLVNVKIIQYKADIKKDGTAPLYLQLRYAKKQARIAIDISVDPKDFDPVRQRILPRNRNAKEFNILIDNIISKCTKIQTDYFLKGQPLDVLTMRQEITNEASRFSFVEFWISESDKQLQRGQIQKSTYKSERESLTRMLKMHKEVLFYQITPNWLEEFEAFLRTVIHLKESTIHKTLKHVRKYVKRAIASGTKMDDPFPIYSLPPVNATRIIWLTTKEVTTLEKHYESDIVSDAFKKTLRPFLFACYTGIRYSDYYQVNADNIHGQILQFIPFKTRRFQKFVRIPLSQKAISFLTDEKNLGDILNQQVINSNLKQIAKFCGIKKTLSTHVARHTFASNWILAGRNIIALQKILGHVKLENTMIYVHLHSRDLQAEMNEYQNWITNHSNPA